MRKAGIRRNAGFSTGRNEWSTRQSRVEWWGSGTTQGDSCVPQAGQPKVNYTGAIRVDSIRLTPDRLFVCLFVSSPILSEKLKLQLPCLLFRVWNSISQAYSLLQMLSIKHFPISRKHSYKDCFALYLLPSRSFMSQTVFLCSAAVILDCTLLKIWSLYNIHTPNESTVSLIYRHQLPPRARNLHINLVLYLTTRRNLFICLWLLVVWVWPF